MIGTTYTLFLHPVEGPTNFQIQVDENTGKIKLSIFSEHQERIMTKSVHTFESDADLKALINILKQARIKSLQAQGYKVVT